MSRKRYLLEKRQEQSCFPFHSFLKCLVTFLTPYFLDGAFNSGVKAVISFCIIHELSVLKIVLIRFCDNLLSTKCYFHECETNSGDSIFILHTAPLFSHPIMICFGSALFAFTSPSANFHDMTKSTSEHARHIYNIDILYTPQKYCKAFRFLFSRFFYRLNPIFVFLNFPAYFIAFLLRSRGETPKKVLRLPFLECAFTWLKKHAAHT